MRSQKSEVKSQKHKRIKPGIEKRHCERSEAILPFVTRLPRTFQVLAMTTGKGSMSGFGKRIMLAFFLFFTIHYSLFTVVFASEKWQGVDESVVEKYAKEHGREAMKPLINTDQGDLLLFVFLLAGTAGGFAAGYYWKTLVDRKPKDKE